MSVRANRIMVKIVVGILWLMALGFVSAGVILSGQIMFEDTADLGISILVGLSFLSMAMLCGVGGFSILAAIKK